MISETSVLSEFEFFHKISLFSQIIDQVLKNEIEAYPHYLVGRIDSFQEISKQSNAVPFFSKLSTYLELK
jgi:hypothetical protein